MSPDICHGSGTSGFTSIKQLWVKNDSAVYYYENVVVTAIDDTADIAVTFSATENGVYTDILTLANIDELGGANDSTSFWRKYIIANGQSQKSNTSINYRITSTEYTV